MSPTLIKKAFYKGEDCEIWKTHYHKGNRVAIFLSDKGEPVATCSVNIPEQPLAPDEVFIKDYSENEGMVDFLVAEGIVERTDRFVASGYVDIPVCRLLI